MSIAGSGNSSVRYAVEFPVIPFGQILYVEGACLGFLSRAVYPSMQRGRNDLSQL